MSKLCGKSKFYDVFSRNIKRFHSHWNELYQLICAACFEPAHAPCDAQTGRMRFLCPPKTQEDNGSGQV